MQSLVAYGDSDETGSDSENELSNENEIPAKAVPVSSDVTHIKGADGPVMESSIDSGKKPTDSGSKPNAGLLSLPSSQMTSINFDLNILDSKRSQPIRINIPSLKELQADEEKDKQKKLKRSTKGSGLFSLLPEPVHVTSTTSKSLVPQSVANRKRTQSKASESPKAKFKQPKTSFLDDEEEEEEEEEKGKPLSSFFFSSLDDVKLPPDDVELDLPVVPSGVVGSQSIETPEISNNFGLDSSEQKEVGPLQPSTIINPNATHTPYHAGEVEDTALDSAALMKLCGSRDRKKAPDLSNIIDVSGSSLMADCSLQLTKDLTKEQPTHSFKRKSECSTLQRRKHQITYLAEQAKAQELELRNNWAQNRMTRKQTQAKYGF